VLKEGRKRRTTAPRRLHSARLRLEQILMNSFIHPNAASVLPSQSVAALRLSAGVGSNFLLRVNQLDFTSVGTSCSLKICYSADNIIVFENSMSIGILKLK